MNSHYKLKYADVELLLQGVGNVTETFEIGQLLALSVNDPTKQYGRFVLRGLLVPDERAQELPLAHQAGTTSPPLAKDDYARYAELYEQHETIERQRREIATLNVEIKNLEQVVLLQDELIKSRGREAQPDVASVKSDGRVTATTFGGQHVSVSFEKDVKVLPNKLMAFTVPAFEVFFMPPTDTPLFPELGVEPDQALIVEPDEPDGSSP